MIGEMTVFVRLTVHHTGESCLINIHKICFITPSPGEGTLIYLDEGDVYHVVEGFLTVMVMLEEIQQGIR